MRLAVSKEGKSPLLQNPGQSDHTDWVEEWEEVLLQKAFTHPFVPLLFSKRIRCMFNIVQWSAVQALINKKFTSIHPSITVFTWQAGNRGALSESKTSQAAWRKISAIWPQTWSNSCVTKSRLNINHAKRRTCRQRKINSTEVNRL